jgi:hypothetical protein
MKRTILPLVLLSLAISSSLVNARADEQVPPAKTIVYNDQSTYFISSNSVRVRSAPDSTGKILGELSLNDKVKIINPTVIYGHNFVEIRIVLTYDPIVKSEKYFVSADFLAAKVLDYKEFLGKYFVVVNVATETLRIYERICADNSCPHKMIMETEVVVGEDTDHPKEEPGKGRSILGSYRITGWSKFYQDTEAHYPAWYNESYPATPKPDASWSAWFSQSVMPRNKWGESHGSMRGAFGWYTAFVAPEPFGQWLHGTLGWGSDKDKFIKKVKEKLINFFADPRSSGCTRNNNEAIAFLRNIVDVGTPIIKIYAKEEVLDPTLKDYPGQKEEWQYVLTTNKNHAIDREEVLKSLAITSQDLDAFWEAKRGGGKLILDPKNPLSQIIEVGTYDIDVHPDTIAYTPGEKLSSFSRKLGQTGNIYGIKEKEMHGVFYIDAGMLEGYAHPNSVLEVSGFADEVTPSWMKHSNLK